MGLRRALPCPTLCGSWRESRLSDLGPSPRDLAFRSIGRTQRRARSRARIAPQFIASFDVPHSLKDVGVSRNEIQQIVPAVLHEVKERAVVDKPITEAEVVALLEASH